MASVLSEVGASERIYQTYLSILQKQVYTNKESMAENKYKYENRIVKIIDKLDSLSTRGKPISENKWAKSSKFLSPPQADGVLQNFAPSGTDFAKAWNPRSKLRGILQE